MLAAPSAEGLFAHAIADSSNSWADPKCATCLARWGMAIGPFTTSDHAISHRLQDCWANFIWTGNPAEPGLLKWPQRHSGNVMLLGDQRSTAPLLSKEQREAFCGWLAASGKIGLF
jgi:carboxylesterase type B